MICDGELGFYWDVLEKTKQERDELLSLALGILELYETELSRRKETERALEKERENTRRERDESLFVVKVNQGLYEEELRQRKEAEEALVKEREEIEKMKKGIEEVRLNALENQRLLEISQKERDEMMAERDDASRILQELSRSLAEEDSSPPSYFICPISHDIMRDPQVAADGFTYEAEEFRKWISSGGYTSPMTNLVLANHDLVPNHALRSTTQDWLQKHPSFLDSS